MPRERGRLRMGTHESNRISAVHPFILLADIGMEEGDFKGNCFHCAHFSSNEWPALSHPFLSNRSEPWNALGLGFFDKQYTEL